VEQSSHLKREYKDDVYYFLLNYFIVRNLGAGRVYDISAEVERWEISSLSSDTPSCTSDFTKVHCNTSGAPYYSTYRV